MEHIVTILFKKNQLYKNSLYLLATNGIASVVGFLFWILIAKNYTTVQIGIATSLFSLLNLVASLSLLGFNTGLLRHLPTSNMKNEKINSSILITSIVSVILAFCFLALPLFSQQLSFVKENNTYTFFFIFFSVITTLNLLSESIFVAFRASLHVLIKVIVQNAVKILLLFLFVSYGAFGIFLTLSFSTLAALIYAAIVITLWFNISYRLHIHTGSVQKMAYVSFGTYFSGLISVVPSFVLPLMITSIVGPSATAYYYIVATTVNILFIIPQVITQNLLVESSYDEEKIKIHTRKSSYLIGAILLPTVLIMIFFGNYVLLIFGKQYSVEGVMLLRIMSIAAVITGINYILGTLLTIYQHIKLLIGINIVGSITLLISSYILLNYGIIGIGYATLVTQIVLLVMYTLALSAVKKLHLLRFLF